MTPSSTPRSDDTRREVVGATHVSSELRSTIRVYRKEFLFEWRDATRAHLETRFDEVYGGRILDADWEIRTNPVRARPFELWIRRWNVWGEYKHGAEAEDVRRRLEDEGYEVEVVPRNSRAEHVLIQYGKVRL